MEIDRFIKNVRPVIDTSAMHDVFKQILENPDIPFLPVVDAQGFFRGIIHELDLKQFAFGMFGRELIKKEKLRTFIRSYPTVPASASLEDVLGASVKHLDADGLIVVKNDRYAGVIFKSSLLAMYDANRTSTLKRLALAQKMEAIGTLAGGIAHDFNNILMPIIGYTDMLTMHMDPSEFKKIGYLKQITVAAGRAKELVGQILAFSRQANNDPFALHIGSIVKEVIKLLKFSIPSTIQIVPSYTASNDAILADPTEIHQILMNLCTNAAHAMRESGGTLSIGISECAGKVNCKHSACDMIEGNFVVLTVGDTGHGILPEIINRIFDPFFTTKKQGEGTGMGLAVVHGIIKRYHGTIDVESEPGRGTTFKIYFPQVAVAPADQGKPVNESAPMAAISPGNCKVLFVDDDGMIVELAQTALESFGFSVAPFYDSIKALNAFEENPRAYDIVITDQTMPNLTGISLARRMLQIRPDLPIILCTGYSEIVSAEMAKAMGIREYILKPVDFSHLSTLLLSHLD